MPDESDVVVLSRQSSQQGPMQCARSQPGREAVSPGAACQAPSIQNGLPLSFLICNGVPLDLALVSLPLTKTYTSVKDLPSPKPNTG